MGQGKFEKKPASRNDSRSIDEKKKPVSRKDSQSIDEKKKPKGKKRNTGRVLLWILIVLLSILLVLMIFAAVAANYVLGRINRYDDIPNETTPTESVAEEIFETDETVEGQQTMDPNDVQWGQVETVDKEHIINILLIGQDARPGEGRARSDSMILVSLDKESGSIQMTSFMRDLYVQIPGYQDNRMNAAFAMGGPELLDETILHNFGVQVDGNVEVDFEAFTEVIDILGGVDLEISREEANYMVNNGVSASAGMNHFDGEEALTFARMRKVSGGDYTRTERQRRLLSACMESVKEIGITEAITLINKVLPYVTTDLTDAQIIEYATAGLNALTSGGEITSTRIPEDDAHYAATIRGMSVLVPDLKMCQEDLLAFASDGEE